MELPRVAQRIVAAARPLPLLVGVLFVVSTFVLLAPSPVGASPGWLIRSLDSGRSTYTGSEPDDPIVFPGEPGASHLHDFFCNKETDAFSTYEQMIAAASSCPSGDTAGYWAPALYRNGVKISPAGPGVRGQIYYRDNAYASGTVVQPFPADFKLVVGNGHATTLAAANAIDPQSGIGAKIGSEIYWGCSNNSTGKLTAPPSNCSTGKLTIHFGFPSCWNGVEVSGDQVKAGTMRWVKSGSCPTSHPIPLPRLIERFEYPVGSPTGSITLASGNIYSVHADFWNTWHQPSLAFLVENCLNANVDCGTNPTVQ
jgi:hypothetical protein